jgi:hypothetical protein
VTPANATGDFHDATNVSAVLTEDGTTPIPGASLSFKLNGSETCSAGPTDASGTASCSITPNEAAGAYPLVASFAGDAFYLPSSGTSTFTVTLEEDTLTSTTSLQVIPQNGTATLSSTLLEDGLAATPVVGRTVTMTLGSSPGQSCTGTTDASGVATCSFIVDPSKVGQGPQTVTDSFTSDGFYKSNSNIQSALVFAFLKSGSFVVGDKTDTGHVQWWGAQWAKNNALISGAGLPNAMKGFADNLSSTPPACGGTYTTDPGNSAPPPDASAIPAYMGVIVSSTVTKSGSTISGDIFEIVVVKTDPGYAGNPGHAGTGTVVAIFCGSG